MCSNARAALAFCCCLLGLAFPAAAVDSAPVPAATNQPPPAPVAAAEPAEDIPPVVVRYEQILLKAPGKGTAFDKVYQHYLQGPGLQALADRWGKAATAAAGDPAKEFGYRFAMGLLAERRAKPAEAREAYEKASKLQPAGDKIWAALGDLAASDGRLPDAVKAYQFALDANPPMAAKLDLYRQMARAKQRNLDEAGAVETWRKLVQEFPDDAFALEEAGAAFQATENFEDAMNAYKKLAELSEENSYGRVQAMIRMAEVEERRGKSDLALRQYEAALPKTAANSWINRDLRARIEQIYRRQDDIPGLAAYYRTWLEKNPSDVDAVIRMATALSEIGKKQEALDALRKAMELAPDRNEVKATVVVRLLEDNKADEAVKVATVLTQADATDPHYWELLGEALWKQTQPATPASKKAVLDAWAKLAPADTKKQQAVMRLAGVLRAHKLHDEARAEFVRALAMVPDSSETRLAYVDYLVELDKKDDAWKELDLIVEGTRATPENYVRLATAWVKYGKLDKAGEALEKGLAVDPKHFELLQAKWNLYAEQQKWAEAIAMFEGLAAASPSLYFQEQLEARHVQMLIAAKLSEEKSEKLFERLNGTPALSEAETRLLIRLLDTKGADGLEQLASVLTAARERFPDSPSVIRLLINQDRARGNYEACMAGVDRLISLQPASRVDLMVEKANLYREQAKLDEALLTAEKLIEFSPANMTGYVLYANIAAETGKRDLARAKLRDAIRLAEKPNEVRLQLVRMLQEDNDLPSAIALLEDALEEAATPEEKLSLMRPLTEVTYSAGKVDELIEKLRKRQRGEEGGWRYGVYLAEIYKQLQDFGAARRELALSLAARPQDANLIKQLIALADKDGDMEEELRYLRMLVEVDPSDAQQLALARHYAQMNRADDAWKVLEANSVALGKDPAAWSDVLDVFTDTDYAPKARALLRQVCGSGSDRAGLLANAEVLMMQDSMDEAVDILWKVVDLPEPINTTQPGPSLSGTQKATGRKSMMSLFNSPLFTRMQNMHQTMQNAQMLTSGSTNRRQTRQAYAQHGRNMPTGASGTSPRDTAIIYLGTIANKREKVEEMLTRLQESLKRSNADRMERMGTYMLLQATDPLWAEIEAAGADPQSTQEVDTVCFTMVLYPYYTNVMEGGPEKKKKLEELRDIFQQRIVKREPDMARSLALMRVSVQLQMMQQGTEQGSAEEKKKLRDMARDVLRHSDMKNPDEVTSAFQLSSLIGDMEMAKKSLDALVALLKDKNMSWNGQSASMSRVMIQQQVMYAPHYVMQASAVPGATPTKEQHAEMLAMLVYCLELSWPEQEPKAQLAASNPYGGSMYQNRGGFPQPNRYYDQTRLSMLQSTAQRIHAIGMTAELDKLLEKQTAAQTEEWKKIYPMLARVYAQWWHGDKAKALALTQEVLALRDSDEFRLMLAGMYSAESKYKESLEQLQKVRATLGPVYISTQLLMLDTAKQAKDTEAAKKAALRLTSLQLPAQDRPNLINDLRELGLTEKAEEMEKRATARSGGSSSGSRNQAQMQQRAMREAMEKDDYEKATALARQMLAGDPLTARYGSYEANNRVEAINVLERCGVLADYQTEIANQLQASPKSQRLNLLMAEAFPTRPTMSKRTNSMPPVWIRITRTGNTFSFASSIDGTNWKHLSGISQEMNPELYVGLAVSSNVSKAPATGTFEGLSIAIEKDKEQEQELAGKEWKLADIGPAADPGTVESLPNNVVRIKARGGTLGGKEDQCAFSYKMLKGDGVMTVRVTGLDCSPGASWAKASLMLRDSLEPNARTVALSQAWTNRALMVSHRKTAGAEMSQNNHSIYHAPLWLRLERKGRSVQGSVSPDGKAWTDLGSQFLDLPDRCYIGLEARSNSADVTATSVWNHIHLTGNTAGPIRPDEAKGEKGVTLAPVPDTPWTLVQYAPNEATENGRATLENGLLKVLSPRVNDLGNQQTAAASVLQPVEGDAVLVAMLDSQVNSSGITIRSGLSAKAVSYMLTLRPDNALVASVTESRSLALPYYRTLAELNPRDARSMLMLAERLRQAGANGEAAEFYLRACKLDMNLVMTGGGSLQSVVDSAKAAGKAEEFLKCVEEWTPPQNSSASYYLVNLGQQLAGQNELEGALRVYKKALEHNEHADYYGASSHVATTLMALKRNDEAVAAVTEHFFPKPAEEKPKKRTILGNTYMRGRITPWQSSHGWGGNGRIQITNMAMLRAAQQLDCLPALLTKAEAKLKEEPGNTDATLMRLSALILLRKAETDEAMKAFFSDQSFVLGSMGQYNFYVMPSLCELLAAWPEKRKLAAQLLKKFVEKNTEMVHNPHLAFQSLRHLAIIATESGDREMAADAWKKLAVKLREGSTGQYIEAEVAVAALDNLLAFGEVAATDELLTALKGNRELIRREGAGRFKLFENEINRLTGKPFEPYLVTRISRDTRGAKPMLHWEISGIGRESGNRTEALFRPFAASPKPLKYTVEVFAASLYSNSDRKLIETWKDVPEKGSRPLQLPPNTYAVVARMTVAPEAAKQPETKAGDGEETKEQELKASSEGAAKPKQKEPKYRHGPIMFLPSGPELLTAGNAPWTSNAGWKTEMVGAGTLTTGQPFPGSCGLFSTHSNQGSREVMMTASRVPIDPAKSYLLTAWIRTGSQCEFGAQALDKNEKVTERDTDGWRQYLSLDGWQLVQLPITAEGKSLPGELLSLKKASINVDVLLKIEGFVEIADISLRQID
ncbi:hypothetical protein DB346_05650 [Verrucomicrobia bacterium LW23]|nr:hypothetical protein DB346_05650 [Verrucomicrobia bacterium LW23]